jgi:NADH:ubiquinone oxidoreductase subunit C
VLEGMTCYFDVKTTPFQSVIVGIGVLKRVRKDEYEGPKSRGGHYQYFGRDAALSTLIEHYTRVQKVIEEYATAKNATITLDQSILQSCEQIPGYAKLPALSSTTITFLSLLLEEAPKTFVALPELSARLAEARREIISADSNANLLDINRRMYDVVSVLISCKILLCPKTNQASKKVVAFNHEVFTDDSALKIGSTWDREPYCDASFCRSIEVEEQKNKFPKNLLRQKHRSKTTKISKKRKSISYPESPRDVAAGLSHFHVVAHLSTPDRIKLRKKVKITEEHLTSPSLTELFLCEENSATQFDGNLTWHERFVCLEEADFLDFVPINDILQWEKMDLMNQMEELWPNLYCDKEGSTHEVEMEPEDEESFMDLTCQEQLFEGW